MKKTQEEINDMGRKLIAKGKTLSPKFFGELENYSSDEDNDNETIVSASASYSSTEPSTSNSPSSSSSPYPLKSILKRKREGGRKTKKIKKSRAKKSRAKKSRAKVSKTKKYFNIIYDIVADTRRHTLRLWC